MRPASRALLRSAVASMALGAAFGVSSEGIRFREGALAGEKLKLFFNQLVHAELGDIGSP